MCFTQGHGDTSTTNLLQVVVLPLFIGLLTLQQVGCPAASGAHDAVC